MPLRPITSEFANAELMGRIAELERKLARLEEAISVGPAGQIDVTSTGPINVTAPNIEVNAATARFSGIVQCDTIIANSVVGTSYTPGAGNVM